MVYTADNTSISYMLLSAHTVTRSMHNQKKLNIYFILCDYTLESAHLFANQVSSSLSCFRDASITVKAFSHPESSPLRLTHRRGVGTPHWFGDTETVRVLIPSILPDLERYIYFDNDILITKKGMINKRWGQDLGNSSVGLVLDATSLFEHQKFVYTYFNNSAFLLQKYFFDAGYAESRPDKNKMIVDFSKALPKFPNNGVMLVDAERWRALNLSGQFLSLAQDCKHAEERGEEHVAWGSQPASIVILRKHWSELPQVCVRGFVDGASGNR